MKIIIGSFHVDITYNKYEKKIMITDCCPKVGDKIINRHLL